METISLKLDEQMLANVDDALKKNDYGTRTEFIRSAIRAELERVRREEAIKEFLSTRGSASRRTTDAEFEEARRKGLEIFLAREKSNDALLKKLRGSIKTKKKFMREKDRDIGI